MQTLNNQETFFVCREIIFSSFVFFMFLHPSGNSATFQIISDVYCNPSHLPRFHFVYWSPLISLFLGDSVRCLWLSNITYITLKKCKQQMTWVFSFNSYEHYELMIRNISKLNLLPYWRDISSYFKWFIFLTFWFSITTDTW